MTKDKRYCNTCGKELTYNDRVYYNDLALGNCYCSYACMIEDLHWHTIKAKELDEPNIKCSNCGTKLKDNDKVYYNTFDDIANYCSYYCMIKDLAWEFD